jgi:integrase
MRFLYNAEFGNNRKHLFADELLEILQAAREDSVRNHAILVVCYSHSLRASEVCNLRLADLNLREKTIHA